MHRVIKIQVKEKILITYNTWEPDDVTTGVTDHEKVTS